LWIKRRNGGNDHNLYNAIVGLTGNYLVSNSTSGENSNNNRIVATSSTGFTVGTGSADTNGSGNTYVAWNWKANGTGSSNTAGSITSTVSANPDAGFSIVSYTPNGTAGATIGHGLGVSPSMIVVKLRETATDGNNKDWAVYHAGADASSPQNYVLTLNSSASRAGSAGSWNNTAPSSTVFTVGTNFTVNNSGKDYVAYCFAEVEGYSKFGSYTGNGSSDGPFVYCGFRPAVVLTKCSTSSGDWFVFDTARDTSNVSYKWLKPNNSGTEPTGTGDAWDILSSGFKPRNGNANQNASGGTYIFAAFAEHPFGGDGVSPATAR
jgi:hypothetical protein